MKNKKEERLEIGRKIYTHELFVGEAANQYDIDWYTARTYYRMYREINNLPPISEGKELLETKKEIKRAKSTDLESLTKEQLIDEVIKARVETERSKKVMQ